MDLIGTSSLPKPSQQKSSRSDIISIEDSEYNGSGIQTETEADVVSGQITKLDTHGQH